MGRVPGSAEQFLVTRFPSLARTSILPGQAPSEKNPEPRLGDARANPGLSQPRQPPAPFHAQSPERGTR